MARFAQRLPVALIPKEGLIPSVRDNVVNHTRGADDALLGAFHAQRVQLQIMVTRPSPLGTIPALCGGSPETVTVVGLIVFGTIHKPRLAHLCAAGVSAWSIRFCGHGHVSKNRPPSSVLALPQRPEGVVLFGGEKFKEAGHQLS